MSAGGGDAGGAPKLARSTVKIASSNADLARCYPVMRELRDALSEQEFMAQVATQSGEGYRIAFVESDARVVAVAGFRTYHMLFSGKTLYVDDLVTAQARRSERFGETLLTWLVERARREGCRTFSLDSGVHRDRAHRFYFRHGMRISSFHFDVAL